MVKEENKILFIDCQVFQTDTWHRGMGKYSYELLKELVAQGLAKKRAVHLVFNSDLDTNHESIEKLKKLFGTPEVTFLKLATPKNSSIAAGINKNQKSLENFIADINGDKEYLIPSLLDTNIYAAFPEDTTNYLVFYDLIPLLFSNLYLKELGARENYFGRFKGIFQADKIFTISQTTLDDLIVHMNLLPEKLVNIDGALIPRNTQASDQPDFIEDKNFILFPSGDDLRKNNQRAVEAFEVFNRTQHNKYKLVITSRFSPESQRSLKKISPNVIFSGNVSESELLWLYKNCSFVFFPPEYEGLGLPVLEAVDENKKVVCSDIKVFREISTEAFYYGNPYDVQSLAQALKEASEDKSFDRKAHYKELKEKYTWKRSADLLLSSVGEVTTKKPERLPKVAIIGPDPSGYSSIGKFIQEVHPATLEQSEVTYYLEKSPSSKHDKPAYLRYVANCYDIEDFSSEAYAQYDRVIYHIGSSDYHIKSIKKALCLPGTLVLHDTDMKGIIDYFLTNGHISQERYLLEQKLTQLLPQNPKKPSVEFAGSVINTHPIIVTHSEYAYAAVQNSCLFDQTVAEFQHPIGTPQQVFASQHKLINIGLAGILHDTKGISILQSLLASGELSNARVHVFGYDFATSQSKLAPIMEYANVELTVNLSDFEFQERLSSLDILLNYRPYYHGEASRATLESMRYGVVPVVRNIGWFSELPDNAAIKANRIEELPELLSELMNNQERRLQMSQNAVAFTKENCQATDYIKGILALSSSSPLGSVGEIVRQSPKLKPGVLNAGFKTELS